MFRRAIFVVVLVLTVFAMSVTSALAGTSLNQQVKSVKKEVAALVKTVNRLDAQLEAQKRANKDLRLQVDAILANPALQLGPFVSVTQEAVRGVSGPNLILTGANLHLRSGSGSTSDGSYDDQSQAYDAGKLTGLGNLIIGYNEDDFNFQSSVRTGSHNLVLGMNNYFSGFAGQVGGMGNLTSGPFACVISGDHGSATGDGSVVVTGSLNRAEGNGTSVLSGTMCGAKGTDSAVVTGRECFAYDLSAVLGGRRNVARGGGTVSSGEYNTASVGYSGISGGWYNTCEGNGVCIGGGDMLHLTYGWAAGFPGPNEEPFEPITAHWFRAE